MSLPPHWLPSCTPPLARPLPSPPLPALCRYLIQDLLYTTVLASVMGFTHPARKLSKQRPPARLMSLGIWLPVILQFATCAAFQVQAGQGKRAGVMCVLLGGRAVVVGWTGASHARGDALEYNTDRPNANVPPPIPACSPACSSRRC